MHRTHYIVLPRLPAQHRQSGFTYLGVLLAMALLGIGLSGVSEVWFTTGQRQRAAQSEWVAQAFVNAIGTYYESAPNRVKRYPKQIEDLLEDRRGVVVQRHLRQVYANPFVGEPSWQWLRAPDGGIMGLKVPTWSPGAESLLYTELVYRPTTP